MTLKNLKVSEDTHQKLAIFCAQNKYRINDTADFLLRFALATAKPPLTMTTTDSNTKTKATP